MKIPAALCTLLCLLPLASACQADTIPREDIAQAVDEVFAEDYTLTIDQTAYTAEEVRSLDLGLRQNLHQAVLAAVTDEDAALIAGAAQSEREPSEPVRVRVAGAAGEVGLSLDSSTDPWLEVIGADTAYTLRIPPKAKDRLATAVDDIKDAFRAMEQIEQVLDEKLAPFYEQIESVLEQLRQEGFEP